MSPSVQTMPIPSGAWAAEQKTEIKPKLVKNSKNQTEVIFLTETEPAIWLRLYFSTLKTDIYGSGFIPKPSCTEPRSPLAWAMIFMDFAEGCSIFCPLGKDFFVLLVDIRAPEISMDKSCTSLHYTSDSTIYIIHCVIKLHKPSMLNISDKVSIIVKNLKGSHP